MQMSVQVERENDGRWLAEVMELSGAMAYGDTKDQAIARVQELSLQIIAERLEHNE